MCWIPGSAPALWPHSTLGWPDDTEDLRYFYPTSVHGDRLRHPLLLGGPHDHDGHRGYWARSPSVTVYLHGLVRDEKGEKMSKIQGNVLDPLEVIEQYGTDALRFALVTGSYAGNDMHSLRSSGWRPAATSPTSSGTPPASSSAAWTARRSPSLAG